MENEVQEPAPKYNYVTPEEYFEIEKRTEYRNEYYNGQVFEMLGSTLKHSQIAVNLYAQIGNFLKEKDCALFPSRMRVTTPSHDLYIYPDTSIVCGDIHLKDDGLDTLLNPAVVFEIISPTESTSIDKGRKFFFYQRIPSFQEYIMIDSTKKFIQVARKQPDESWKFEEIDGKGDSLTIRTIQYNLPLESIYYRTGL